MKQQIEVLYEDKDIIVCRKPTGIPVQTAKLGQQDMVSLLKNYRVGQKEAPEIYVVHRLDQPVEGVMIFAKNQKAAAALSKQIQQKSVDKYYYAVVEGVPEPAEGRLEDYLLRDGKSNISRVVAVGMKDAKKATLDYKVLQTTESQQRSLLEIHLETGRHHQIRVQMAHAGHPLVGDKKYNPQCRSGYLPIGLCSVKLSFCHPITGKRQEYAILPQGEAFADFNLG